MVNLWDYSQIIIPSLILEKTIQKLLKMFSNYLFHFLKGIDLIGSQIIAIDGTKSRAHNGKKNNYNQKENW